MVALTGGEEAEKDRSGATAFVAGKEPVLAANGDAAKSVLCDIRQTEHYAQGSAAFDRGILNIDERMLNSEVKLPLTQRAFHFAIRNSLFNIQYSVSNPMPSRAHYEPFLSRRKTWWTR